jgi:hypothetical protein
LTLQAIADELNRMRMPTTRGGRCASGRTLAN